LRIGVCAQHELRNASDQDSGRCQQMPRETARFGGE
jgi:hypothetical protein